MYSVCAHECVVWPIGLSSSNNSFQASFWYDEVTDREAAVECGKIWTAELAAGPEITSVNLLYITWISNQF